ncbi:PaREP1 family protein [Vulcanisaeta sp. JCM 16159]|nr:PaREP1 family protein [Vulcanisaeta sp. JCM 16159]
MVKAYDLHVRGFHEGKYGIDQVRVDLPLVEWFVNYTGQLVAR